jgi:hypothetical protein
MKYLCLVYFEPVIFDRMSAAEKKALDRDSLSYDEELQRSGKLIHAEALQSPKAAVTVRVRNKNVASTDGPFAETKEQLGGFILVEAKDMQEARHIASGIPLAKYGSIEVRPIYNIPTD